MSDLISREALIDVIEKQKIDNDAYCRLCIDSMKELIEEHPSVTDTNVGGKWIPCSERLPDIKEGEYASDCVLVTLKWWDGEISETVGWYNRTGTWSEDGKMSKVIAWMPYEPYKGE